MSKIAIIGTGYVGLVSGSCLADFGNYVTCVDNNEQKIKDLEQGLIPIYEPGLGAVVKRNIQFERLQFTTNLKDAVEKNEVLFVAVGTPPADDGSADLVFVEQVAREIGQSMNSYKVIVDKSTVPVGTARKVRTWVQDELDKRQLNLSFDVVSNPEFLREGAAVQDFMHPDRVVIGAESSRAKELMKDVYRALYINETPYIETGLETAEMIKYASNAFLAVKITFINEVANLCEEVGANVQDVAKAMGKDGRIGSKFLHPGPGYGGSCFPKDTLAMARTGRDNGIDLSIVETTIKANESQKLKMVEKIRNAYKENQGVDGKVFAILGLSFKPNTDDMRESPAITIIEQLVESGAKINAYDPAAIKEASWRLEHIKDKVNYCKDEYETMEGADALIILTEWNQFRNLDLTRVKKLIAKPIIFDLRNIYKRMELESQGFSYFGVGI
jgi:UDPglucose 6-dehydrogenase